jgi:hypothetical protein
LYLKGADPFGDSSLLKNVAEWRKPSGDSAEHAKNRAACAAPLLCVGDEQLFNKLIGSKHQPDRRTKEHPHETAG